MPESDIFEYHHIPRVVIDESDVRFVHSRPTPNLEVQVVWQCDLCARLVASAQPHTTRAEATGIIILDDERLSFLVALHVLWSAVEMDARQFVQTGRIDAILAQ